MVDIDSSYVLSKLARRAGCNIEKHIPHLQLHSSALKHQQLAHLQMNPGASTLQPDTLYINKDTRRGCVNMSELGTQLASNSLWQTIEVQSVSACSSTQTHVRSLESHASL